MSGGKEDELHDCRRFLCYILVRVSFLFKPKIILQSPLGHRHQYEDILDNPPVSPSMSLSTFRLSPVFISSSSSHVLPTISFKNEVLFRKSMTADPLFPVPFYSGGIRR